MKLRNMFHSAMNGIKTGRYVWAVRHGAVRENTMLLESKNANDLAGNLFQILKELTSEEYSDMKVFLAVRKECEEKIKQLILTFPFPPLLAHE